MPRLGRRAFLGHTAAFLRWVIGQSKSHCCILRLRSRRSARAFLAFLHEEEGYRGNASRNRRKLGSCFSVVHRGLAESVPRVWNRALRARERKERRPPHPRRPPRPMSKSSNSSSPRRTRRSRRRRRTLRRKKGRFRTFRRA